MDPSLLSRAGTYVKDKGVPDLKSRPTPFTLIIIPLVILAPNLAYATQSNGTGAYIDSVRFIQYLDDNVALEELKSGNLDTYYFRIPLEAASEIKNIANLKEYDKLSGSFGLLLNPAPSNNSNSLNPFSLREVRYAINYLIDRAFVVDEILKGLGTPLVGPYGIFSPEYFNVIDSVESSGVRYNPRLADQIITDAMNEAGAQEENGKWTFNGRPVSISILIRSDNQPLRSVGELVASELEKAGFTVKRNYGDLNKANTVVYGSNPQDLGWNVYTEAFGGTGGFVKYNPVIPSQMYAPYFGSMPGQQNPAFWNYRNDTIDKLGQRIQFLNFTSEEERNSLIRNVTGLGVQEAVRIFIAQLVDPYVASSKLTGLVNDFGAGISSKFSLINVRTQDPSNTMDIGVKQIYQGAWNGVGGCSDAYCRDISSALSDPGTFRDPYTGEVIPMRTPWVNITTRGPLEKLVVPDDSMNWDPVSQQWKGPGKNNTAFTVVKYDTLYSNWHNGIPMSSADLLYPQYFVFEWGMDTGDPADLTKDPEYMSGVQPGLPLIKGIRFLDNGTVESYVDQWHFDEKELAGTAGVWAGEPWEITAASERLITSGKAAFSRGEATSRNVPWLSLIIPSHATMIRNELSSMKAEGFVPAPLRDFVTPEEAGERYDASIKWIDTHRHAVIGNGPFYLDSYNPEGRVITLKAFRDSSYPFEKGHWSKYETPKIASIDRVDVPRNIIAGQNPLRAEVTVSIEGEPAKNASVFYFVSDKDGRTVISGNSSIPDENGKYSIEIPANKTALLPTGPSVMKFFAVSDSAYRPDIQTTTIIAVNPLFGPMQQ
ncbi:MAG TPA: ABC transporter substrate-binding protein [Nitrososphaeraceae archaeon]|nr:ABC transporter substrate-binding protein [Nitrososphaeraceae archaeon]